MTEREEITLDQSRTFLSRIFLTTDHSRLRAGWRLFIAFFLTGLFFNIVDWIRSALSMTGPVSGIVSAMIDVVVVTSAIFIARRFADKRSIASLGLKLNKQAGVDLFVGIAVSLALMSLIYIIEYSFGWVKFESFAWQTDSPAAVLTYTFRYLVILIVVGWNEELIYRGYILQTLTSGFNLIWALFITSVYFGVEHLSNPNSSWASTVGIFFIGLFFAYAYLRTNQLWLPIGIHIGWNFFQNAVFGFPVSGFDRPGLFHISVSGPEIWTGGAFGPEAGIIILPVCILGAMLVNMYTRHHTDFWSSIGD